MWLNHGDARFDRGVAIITDGSFHGAGALLYVDGSPRAVYAASTAAVSRVRNARELRPGNEPEAEDSSSTDSGMPGLEPIGGPLAFDAGNPQHLAMLRNQNATVPLVRAQYGHPGRHSFGGPTLANAQLQSRHNREARELRAQELQQLGATGVIARPRRIIRRRAQPRPRLVFQGNVEGHFDSEIAGWYAAANEPNSPRTESQRLRLLVSQACNAYNVFMNDRGEEIPIVHDDVVEEEITINRDTRPVEHTRDDDGPCACYICVEQRNEAEVAKFRSEWQVNPLFSEKADHRRGYPSPVGSEHLGEYSNGSVTPSDHHEFNPVWRLRDSMPRYGFSYDCLGGSYPNFPQGFYCNEEVEDGIRTIPTWMSELFGSTDVVCFAPHQYEVEAELHYVELSGNAAEDVARAEQDAIRRLIHKEVNDRWSSWKRNFMPYGSDLEEVLYRRGLHPLRHNPEPNVFYVGPPGTPKTQATAAAPRVVNNGNGNNPGSGATASTGVQQPAMLPRAPPVDNAGHYGPWLAMVGESSGSSSGISHYSGSSASRCNEPGDDPHYGEDYDEAFDDNGDWQRDYRETHQDSD